MILRDRVPFRVSWWGMIAVLVLGFLVLPGWSQSKKESPQLPEVESKDDVTDELAEPPADVDAGSIKVPVETADRLETITIKQPLETITIKQPVVGEKLEVFVQNEPQVINVTFPQKEPLEIDVAVPRTSRNRDARLQKLEEQLKSLLGELQDLRGKKKTPITVRSTPSIKFVKKPSTFTGILRTITGVTKQQEALIAEKRFAEAQADLTAAQRQIQAEAAKQRDLAKTNFALADAYLTTFGTEAKTKQAEVVETKTITLVRTTYRINRVDAKSLEALIKNIVKADVLQIQITDRRISIDLLSVDSELAPAENQRFIPGVGTVSEKQIFGSTITITTTPEHQQYIGQLIALIEKAPRLKGPKPLTPSTPGRRSRLRRPINSLELLQESLLATPPDTRSRSGQPNNR